MGKEIKSKESFLFEWLVQSILSHSDWTKQEIEHFVEIMLNKAMEENEK